MTPDGESTPAAPEDLDVPGLVEGVRTRLEFIRDHQQGRGHVNIRIDVSLLDMKPPVVQYEVGGKETVPAARRRSETVPAARRRSVA